MSVIGAGGCPSAALSGPARRTFALTAVAWLAFLAAGRGALAAGGVPLDEAPSRPGAARGPVWDLSKPLWVFFAQERFLAPEWPFNETIPRAAFAHLRPAGPNARFFFILAGIGYLGLYHREAGSFELEASAFTMLYPVGDPLYESGVEVVGEAVNETWFDTSLRLQRTWGPGDGTRLRLGMEYQYALRHYVKGDETLPAFVLPEDTGTHDLSASVALDSRRRGRFGDYVSGHELEAGFLAEDRERWSPWGAGGAEFADPAAERPATAYASWEWHGPLREDEGVVLHTKVRGATGEDMDRLSLIRIGGGGFGRQFARVGAGSTGAANDGELFRSDGVPGYFGGEYLTDRYVQVNVELDLPAGKLARFHVSAAHASFRDAMAAGTPWKELAGFALGYTKILDWVAGLRLDLGYSPRPDGAFADSGDFTVTYLRKF